MDLPRDHGQQIEAGPSTACSLPLSVHHVVLSRVANSGAAGLGNCNQLGWIVETGILPATGT